MAEEKGQQGNIFPPRQKVDGIWVELITRRDLKTTLSMIEIKRSLRVEFQIF